MTQIKLKVKVNDLNLVTELQKFGRITYIDNMINLVFLVTNEEVIDEISKLPFVTKVTKSRNVSLQIA